MRHIILDARYVPRDLFDESTDYYSELPRAIGRLEEKISALARRLPRPYSDGLELKHRYDSQHPREKGCYSNYVGEKAGPQNPQIAICYHFEPEFFLFEPERKVNLPRIKVQFDYTNKKTARKLLSILDKDFMFRSLWTYGPSIELYDEGYLVCEYDDALRLLGYRRAFDIACCGERMVFSLQEVSIR